MARALVGNLGETVSKISDYFTDLPKVAAPFTTVVNRAQVTNFAADGLPKFGIDRVMIQQVQEVQGEQGPNGERVFKAVNDVHDAVRFVGNWLNAVGTNGQSVYANLSPGSYAEITFYGTGINLLVFQDAINRDLSVSIDGGGASTIANTGSDITQLRNYSGNAMISMASGLTLGMHTVKITSLSTANRILFGYEVVNASSSIFLPTAQSYSGSKSLTKTSTSTAAYNSGFESGTLGTRGGHVLVYQKSDGTIAKAVTPTNSVAAYLSSADHTNEEVIRTYHWREFGAGRSDDFSSLITTTSNRAFTLDDGTTSLVGSSVKVIDNEFIGVASTGGFITVTFVGTGLDFVRKDSAVMNPHTGFIDGTSIGLLSSGTANEGVRIQKIASGLPYGTHTFRLNCDTFFGNNFIQASQFIVYGPKTPTLPAGAVALADYFVMADFAANTTAGLETIATGVVRKVPMREMVYVNGTGGTNDWATSLAVTAYPTGWTANTDRQNAYFEYTFFGTGFEHRFGGGSNRSANIQISLQSLSTGGSLQNLTSTNFPSISTSTYGTGASFNATTGIYDQQDAAGPSGSGLRISGLPLALYKVRFLNNTASSFLINDAFDIITPIHAPKEIGPARLQNVSLIGSCCIRDLRKFSELQVSKEKAWCQAVGVSSGPTTTSTTANVPLADLSCVIKTTGGPIQVTYNIPVTNNTVNAETVPSVYLNGVYITGSQYSVTQTSTTTGQRIQCSTCIIIPVAAGTHKVDVYWSVSAGTGTAVSSLRLMNVREI